MLKAFADDLKAIREEKNLSLRSISQQTRLNIVILENIENGDFNFQPQAYIRAFLKQYIASLGLDVEEVLFDYDLARNGKYKAKRINIPETKPPVEKKPEVEPEEKKSGTSGKIKEPASEKTSATKKTEAKTTPTAKDTVRPDISEKEVRTKKIESRVSQPLRTDSGYSNYGNTKKGFFQNLLNSPYVRNISMILFILLVLVGLYSLVNILFFEGSKDNPEIIRQNFDDVVKEQEKKILGKRTPEEIQDSIRKADAEALSSRDSITLKVTALSDGIIFIVTDSTNYNRPKKVSFVKGDFGVFKAKNTFHVSSTNTKSFKATINDIPLTFDNTSVSKVKIDKTGAVK